MPPEIASTAAPTVGDDTTSAAPQSQDQVQAPEAGTTAYDEWRQSGLSVQAYATQKSQLAAAALTELGLGKNASVEDIQAAINALREERATGPDEFEDPVLAERARDLDKRAWKLAEEQVGPVVAQAAREFFDEMRTTRDPLRFVRAFLAAAMDAAPLLTGAQSQDQAQPAGRAAPSTTPVPELRTPGQAPASNQRPNPADFRGRTAEYLRALRGIPAEG